MADFDKLTNTAKELSDFSLPKYNELPDIELYMDQITGYLNKLLCKTCRSEDGAPLTANRVNNYVKDGRIKRPVQKKYDRDRIAMLYMLCCSKQNLALPEASALLSMLEREDTSALYEEFRTLQEPIVRNCASELLQCEQGEEALLKKALELTLRSTAERFVAESIIASLWQAPADDKKEKNKKDKKNNDKQKRG